jgi:hypothetical protein
MFLNDAEELRRILNKYNIDYDRSYNHKEGHVFKIGKQRKE